MTKTWFHRAPWILLLLPMIGCDDGPDQRLVDVAMESALVVISEATTCTWPARSVAAARRKWVWPLGILALGSSLAVPL